MPIRMVDDPNDQFDNSGNESGSGGRRPGGGGNLFQLLPLLLGIIRNPLGIVLVLLVGCFLYFKGGCTGLMQQASSSFSGMLDPKEFDKAPLY